MTMRARFVHEGETCRVFGVVFTRMEWVDVSHLTDDHRRKLAANPTFHVDDVGEDAPVTEVAAPKAPSRPKARLRAKAAR